MLIGQYKHPPIISGFSSLPSLFTGLGLLLMVCWPSISQAAIVVAAADSLPEEKERADLVCDGVDDQEQLALSLAKARHGEILVDINPKQQKQVTCARNHAVKWLPGNYQLSATLEIPDAADCVIEAEGTTFHFSPATGDCLKIRGMNRCRYRFGTIETRSSGAAICVQPTVQMPALMSFVSFMGLCGHEGMGRGLFIDPAYENICVNRFEGTDIAGFDYGVCVGGVGGRESSASSHGKCDTNWFWLSYIRMCNTCILESANGVDCSVWEVNVDASLPDSVAIRTGGAYGKWYVIMGTYTHERKNKALVLSPGARHSVLEIHPPLQDFAWEDNSQSDTNRILSTASEGFEGRLHKPSRLQPATTSK